MPRLNKKVLQKILGGGVQMVQTLVIYAIVYVEWAKKMVPFDIDYHIVWHSSLFVDWLQSLKHIFINVSYYIRVASLTRVALF